MDYFIPIWGTFRVKKWGSLKNSTKTIYVIADSKNLCNGNHTISTKPYIIKICLVNTSVDCAVLFVASTTRNHAGIYSIAIVDNGFQGRNYLLTPIDITDFRNSLRQTEFHADLVDTNVHRNFPLKHLANRDLPSSN